MVVALGKVFMTWGWGEIARVCRTGGALVIHLIYDGASLMFFKVFGTEGRRLECCPGEDQARQSLPRQLLRRQRRCWRILRLLRASCDPGDKRRQLRALELASRSE